MADGRRNNGGHSTKGHAGRKPKKQEIKLIEKLTPLMPEAFRALNNAIKDNESWAIKLAMEYYYGKPRQQMDITTGGEKINITPINWVETE